MRYSRASLVLLCSLGASLVGAPTVSANEAIGRVPTVTRLVKIFFELESDLTNSVAKRDKQAVEATLTNDFEMRIAAAPANPVPRAAWIKRSFAEPQTSSEIEQMAVHDYGGVATVSFLWKTTVAKSKATHDLFIVDLWKQSPKGWQLATRYAAPANDMSFAIPGAALPPAFEKRE